MAQLLRPCIIVTLYALLLPVFGPLLDHHFIEWQHNHAHVYFDGALRDSRPGHSHVYEISRSHDHILGSRTLSDESRPDGVAYLTSYDGAGTGLIYAPTGPATESPGFPNPGDCLLLLGYASRDVPPPSAFTAPPRKPPRI